MLFLCEEEVSRSDISDTTESNMYPSNIALFWSIGHLILY